MDEEAEALFDDRESLVDDDEDDLFAQSGGGASRIKSGSLPTSSGSRAA